MGPLELLNQTDDDLKAWTLSEAPAILEQTLSEIWQQIQDSHFYAGQPRSAESERGVALAKRCLQVATHSGKSRLVAQAVRILARSLTANEQYEESLAYHQLAIQSLNAEGEAAQAARAR